MGLNRGWGKDWERAETGRGRRALLLRRPRGWRGTGSWSGNDDRMTKSRESDPGTECDLMGETTGPNRQVLVYNKEWLRQQSSSLEAPNVVTTLSSPKRRSQQNPARCPPRASLPHPPRRRRRPRPAAPTPARPAPTLTSSPIPSSSPSLPPRALPPPTSAARPPNQTPPPSLTRTATARSRAPPTASAAHPRGPSSRPSSPSPRLPTRATHGPTQTRR